MINPSVRRNVALPLASLVALVLLLATVSTLVKWQVPLPRCAFKSVTGLPCFTCGSTRALAALGAGEISRGFRFNPLVVLVCLAVPVWLVGAMLRNAFAPRWRPSIRPRLKIMALAAGLGLILNWIYLILELPR